MANLQANLVSLISELSEKAESRLYKEGGELLDRSLNCLTFEKSLLELKLQVLDELCELPLNVSAGRPDPALRAARQERRRQAVAEAAVIDGVAADGPQESCATPETPVGSYRITPKDEWDVRAARLDPALGLPGPKLEGRRKLEQALEGPFNFLIRQAGKRFRLAKEGQDDIPISPGTSTPQPENEDDLSEDGWSLVKRADWRDDAAFAMEPIPFLRRVQATRLAAIATLRREAADAVQSDKPQSPEALERCLNALLLELCGVGVRRDGGL